MKKKLTLAVFALAAIAAGAFLAVKNYQANRGASFYGALSLADSASTAQGIPAGPAVPAPATCPASGYRFVTKWGVFGTGNGQFNFPTGVAVDRVNHFVYVVEGLNARVQKFTESGGYLAKWGATNPYGQVLGQPASAGFFNTPQWVAVDTSGNVYVSDAANYVGSGSIQKFSSSGNFIRYIGAGAGIGNGQLSSSQGVAIDQTGNIYVADNAMNGSVVIAKRIQKFTSSGAYSAQWGSYGMGNNQFLGPKSVAVAPNGDVYVGDSGSVKRFTSGGVFISKFGTPGSGNGQFGLISSPSGVAVDASGYVYVVDIDNNRIEKFTAAGAYVTQWGDLGSGDGQFLHPNGIAVDSQGNVYVVDSGNNRIQKFSPCTSLPSVPVTVAKPDLIVENFTWTPTNPRVRVITNPANEPTPNTNFKVTATIKNIGNAPAILPVGTQISFLKGGVNYGRQQLLSSVTIPVGQTYNVTIYQSTTPNILSTAGTFGLTVYVDDYAMGTGNAYNLVDESNEGNNTLTKQITILP